MLRTERRLIVFGRTTTRIMRLVKAVIVAAFFSWLVMPNHSYGKGEKRYWSYNLERLCIGGVQYLRLENGITPHLDSMGKIVRCIGVSRYNRVCIDEVEYIVIDNMVSIRLDWMGHVVNCDDEGNYD